MNLERANWRLTSNWQQLENFTIAPMMAGHFSPIGFLSSGSIVGNFLSRVTGQTTFAILNPSGEIEPATRELSIAESVSNDFVCGSIGFGERAFCYHPTTGVVMLPSEGYEFSSAQSVNSGGVVAGSVTNEQGEFGATWRDGQLEITECIRNWTHILEDGTQVGVCQEGSTLLYKTPDGEIDEIASSDHEIIGMINGEWVLSRRQGAIITILRSDREILRSGRISLIDSSEESLLLQLINEEGVSKWVELQGDHLRQIEIATFPNKMHLRSVSCYGPGDSLIGIADDGNHSSIIVFEPERIDLSRAVISN